MTNRVAVDAFNALADETRHLVFERVAAGPASVGDLAKGLPVSRSAVSQHLRVLKEAGLVYETAEGTRRIYHLNPQGLITMREWLDGHWSSALDAFAKSATEKG